jgi:dTDP-4-amino-4,6-dideoxygalactose transaminase
MHYCATVATRSDGAPVDAGPAWVVPLSDLVVDETLLAAAHDAVASGWWSMGPRVAEFEQAFAESTGAGQAIAVSSGTSALHLALVALGLGPGEEAVLPSLNFVAAANTIAHTGATPVFCDVRGPRDLNLDPEDLEAAISPATRALVVLHYGGHPCDMAAVLDVAERHGLVVIEDAAHAPGATWQGRSCGTIGRVGCFSFFSNKNMPIGEGGMIVTDDDELAARIRLLRSHGMTTLTWDRHRGHASSYDVVETGFNFRLDEIRAAIGLVQLGRLAAENEARASVVDRYRARLSGQMGIVVPFDGLDGNVPSNHLAVIVVPEGRGDDVRAALRAERIQTSMHYPPIHRFTAYADRGRRRELPVTDDLADRLITLPLYGHLSDAEVDLVADAVLRALQ